MFNLRSNTTFNPYGPAVQLANSSSLFPLHLAECWRALGMETAIVSRYEQKSRVLDNGTKIISSCEFENCWIRLAKRFYPYLHDLEKIFVSHYKPSYRLKTGREEPDPWEPYFVAHLLDALPVASAAVSLRPRFVFGHEVGAYGLATAFCKNIPRILFPWGADVFLSAETSPIYYKLIKYSLNSADLIVPSSTTAARHIRERFGIPGDKVQEVSWGVDRSLFKRADSASRREICAKLGINPGATIVLNPRRFMPAWGCFVALDVFLQLAVEYPQTHFVLLGGQGTHDNVELGRKKIKEKGLIDRFTLFDTDIPLHKCAELMSVSDLFVSLLGRGDMRSWSVTQSAASGGIPIITDMPEYREMEKAGFSCFLINPESVEEILTAFRYALDHPDQMEELRHKNYKFIAENEDHHKQMKMMLNLIDSVCDKYSDR